MTYYEPPSEGSRACMIYKHSRRLEDACGSCSLSATFCAANTDINGQRCCAGCSH
jgi:hypothetical protein